MKVQAIIFAMAIAAVSAQPYSKQPASEPITDKSQPAVRANAAESLQYAGQAVYDLGREAKVNVVEPTAEFGANTGKVAGHSVAGGIKRVGAGAAGILGNTARLVTNSGKLIFETADRLVAEPMLNGADYLRDGAEFSAARRDVAAADLQEQTQHGLDAAHEHAHNFKVTVQETAREAQQKTANAFERATEKTRQTKEDAKANLKSNKEAAQERLDNANQRLAESRDHAAHKSRGFFERIAAGARSVEKNAASGIASAAQTTADKAAGVEDHAARKQQEHEAKADKLEPSSAARFMGAATAGLVAVVATAASVM